MKQLLLLMCCLFIATLAMPKTIVVKNKEELNAANKQAKPGDLILLEAGEWNNVAMVLTCSGTKDKPITFRASVPGKVRITGNSYLKLGGSYIIVSGLHFIKGYAGDEAVIDFRVNKNQLANNCRITNCTIEDFNNPKRMDENNWILFYGKNNRLDHCSFINKKNMGVLLAVVLDDDRSRQNFHSIDHNYFGLRVPLASNGGEIIRVGVSQHCEFNSNTIISDNFFEHCDGEAEVISIKSGSNIVRNNLFYECQGSVVLRHGDNNTVENNIFLGNGKEGTGGVRVINRGQWVVHNYFYRCRGTGFRSPLAIMNGVPNSPAHRYVQVTDAVIANNNFSECSFISLGEGSDKERSVPPSNVLFLNNTFYNSGDSIFFKAYDDISGFRFSGNKIDTRLAQPAPNGFERSMFTTQKRAWATVPKTYKRFSHPLPDSLQQAALKRLRGRLSPTPGASNEKAIENVQRNARNACGAEWYRQIREVAYTGGLVDCSTAAEVYELLSRNQPINIRLTAKEYSFDKPLYISNYTKFIANYETPIIFNTGKTMSAFIIRGKGHLAMTNIFVNAAGIQATNFIASDTTGSSERYSVSIEHCMFRNFSREKGCQSFLFANKSTVADSIAIRHSSFIQNSFNHLVMNAEKDDKGYYNAERIILEGNDFVAEQGILIDIYRGGNDESTLGPKLTVNNNRFTNCIADQGPLIQLTGVQKTQFTGNDFRDCQPNGKLFIFKDIVRADHVLQKNSFKGSGEIQANGFVKSEGNTMR
ncbi:MAG TPA: polysaccharide lyase 6 family protein [Chitinophagaceae bacterium]|nr:polysaccharide lyase 6 family protein [Chitinophagaceae bacterium]